MRDSAIQQMRVAAMIIIVVYHCVCYYGVWSGIFLNRVTYGGMLYWRGLCNVALNAFVFISGVLYAKAYLKGKYCSRRKFLGNKIQRLLVPYALWSIIAVSFFPSENITMQLLTGIQHLWFLLMLMMIFIIVAVTGINALKYSVLMGGVFWPSMSLSTNYAAI